MRRLRLSARSAFSTVEVMVASTVLVIAIGGTLLAHISARNLMRTGNETDSAITALQTGMEEILVEARDDIPGLFPEGQALALDDFGLTALNVVPAYPNFDGINMPTALEVRLVATWTTFEQGQRSIGLVCVKGP